MNGIKLCGTGAAAPAKIVTNDDMAAMVETNDEWITTRTGIKERHYCTEETLLSLCVDAARQAMERSGVSPADLGVCLVATISPDFVTPAVSCLLQRELGLPEDCLCMDLNAACSGFLYGLHTAQCLLDACPRKYGLVVGGEAFTRMVDFTDRTTCILFGDGAGAAVVRSGPDCPVLHTVVGARGDDKVLYVPGAGTGAPQYIHMEGTAVFKFAVETVPKCITQVLEQAGMTADDIDLFVLHQANERIIDRVVKNLHLPPEKCPKNIAKYGNTSAASIPLLLHELCASGALKPGMRALLSGFGGGLTWGGAILELDGEAH